MARALLIKSGKVVNAIIVDRDRVPSAEQCRCDGIILSETVGQIGDAWDGKIFTPKAARQMPEEHPEQQVGPTDKERIAALEAKMAAIETQVK